MRVEVNTPDEFLDELKSEHQNVYLNIVRVRTDFTWDQEEQITRTVGLWATALIRHDDGDYVLELGYLIGSEDVRKKESMHCTREAARIKAMIREVCNGIGLELRHGKWEVL